MNSAAIALMAALPVIGSFAACCVATAVARRSSEEIVGPDHRAPHVSDGRVVEA